jgi:hypothetical protein
MISSLFLTPQRCFSACLLRRINFFYNKIMALKGFDKKSLAICLQRPSSRSIIFSSITSVRAAAGHGRENRLGATPGG